MFCAEERIRNFKGYLEVERACFLYNFEQGAGIEPASLSAGINTCV